jgi:hypothetical protein
MPDMNSGPYNAVAVGCDVNIVLLFPQPRACCTFFDSRDKNWKMNVETTTEGGPSNRNVALLLSEEDTHTLVQSSRGLYI